MLRILTLCVSLIHLSVVSSSAVIHVPADVTTIESALLAAAPYDTVIVAPGTYFVNLEWPATPGIKLLSEAGPHATILDGRDDVQVIGIYTGVDTTTVVRGFTIQNGHAEGQ
ncbi:MAG: hypothetical protein ABIK85_02910 [Candidatus Eisenbacteria bacterium]